MTVRRARRGAWTRRAFLTGAVLGLCAGCTSDGHFSVLGYSTKPLYDEDIRTVYVPIFQNRVFQTGPYRGLEFQLTRALIREIEANTPFKVVSDPCRADTELLGTVLTLTKGTVLR
ncbi:MAG TPA: LPS assembly lipoprotein LptE, partial [Gemmataceae bacterium]